MIMGRNNKKKRILALRILLVLGWLLLAGIGIYFNHGYKMWGDRLLPNTIINDVNYGGMTAEEANDEWRRTNSGRFLFIHELGDAVERISYDDFDFHYVLNPTFEEMIRSQNLWSWLWASFNPTPQSVDSAIVYDEAKLTQIVHELSCMSSPLIRDPRDARIDKLASGYVLVPADDGNRLDEEKTFACIKAAVEDGAHSIDLDKQGCYKKASLYETDPDLSGTFSLLDKAQKTVLSLNLEGGTYVTLDKNTFLPWMSYTNGTVIFEEDDILAYTKQLAATYNTFRTTRAFRTTRGDVVNVGGSAYDNYGYSLNVSQSKAIIEDALYNSVSQTISLSWNQLAAARDSERADFGSTYIEISLDEQHLWYYRDGSLALETDIVSGTATPSRATPTMVVHVQYKSTDHTMRGSYGESHADYVLNIHSSGIHIHDSAWRSDYGGSIWLSNGSHGCINTPPAKMAQLFGMVDVDTPVIIYDRYNHVSSFQNESYTSG